MFYVYLVFFVILIWIAYEMYTAPSGEQILGKGFVETKPGKKLRELLKNTIWSLEWIGLFLLDFQSPLPPRDAVRIASLNV